MKEYDVYIHEGLRMLQSVMREFTERFIMPVRQKLDDDQDHVITRGILQELVNTDFYRSPFPEDIGGLGLGISNMASALGSEELGRGDGGIAVSAGCSIWPFMSALWADNRTILELFGKQVCGNDLKLGCLSMTEPNAGCDVENETMHGKKIRTIAKQAGDEWVINGQKMWATNSGIADFYCALCTTDPNAGEDGVALIFVPKDAPGLSFGPFENKAGMASDRNCPIYLDDVRVPLEYRVAGPGKDYELLMRSLTLARVNSAAQAVGNAQEIFDTVLKYTGERVVAGKPIRQHSIAAGMLADMAIGIETARSAYIIAAHVFDNPDKFGPQSSHYTMSKANIAKVYATDVQIMVANKAMELMGSYGYVRDYDIEKYWRDGKIIQLWMGGAQVGRFDILRSYYNIEL